MPCRAAKKAGVALTTADSLSELRKIAQGFPTAEVLLRIRQDDPSARCQLGNKYGAEAADIPGASWPRVRFSIASINVSVMPRLVDSVLITLR